MRSGLRFHVSKPRALVIRAPGTNCDAELERAFVLGGAACDRLHLDQLAARPTLLREFQLIGFPGGFSYGDDVASGRIFAMTVRERLYEPLREAAERGALMIGVCNGFQVLAQVGLLPGPAPGEPWPADAPPPQSITLTENVGGRFVDAWIPMIPEPASVCVWTRGLEPDDEIMRLPVAHGEGRLVTSGPGVVRRMEEHGQVALRYGENFNGSEGAIAGVCDVTGRIFGLMPHPERYLDWTRHPWWTRLDASVRRAETPGLRIFRNAVEAASEVPAGVRA